MQTILGGGGAIGVPLAKELTNYTDKVRIVGRTPKKVNESDEVVAANLLNFDEVLMAVEGSDVAYLTVGLTYSTKVWQKEWPVVMRNVIDACKQHATKLVFIDNVYMYDSGYTDNMTEETPVNPSSEKGRVRAEIASMLFAEVERGELTALIARSADFYGPGKVNSLINTSVVEALKNRKPVRWIGNKNKVHNFTFTLDAAKAAALLGNTADAYNQVWHLPTDKTLLTGSDWIALFAKEMQVKARCKEISFWKLKMLSLFIPILREFSEIYYQYSQNYFFDSSKFHRRFNFDVTGVEYGIHLILNAESKNERYKLL